MNGMICRFCDIFCLRFTSSWNDLLTFEHVARSENNIVTNRIQLTILRHLVFLLGVSNNLYGH